MREQDILFPHLSVFFIYKLIHNTCDIKNKKRIKRSLLSARERGVHYEELERKGD